MKLENQGYWEQRDRLWHQLSDLQGYQLREQLGYQPLKRLYGPMGGDLRYWLQEVLLPY